jgi:hypothetical protein
VTGEFLFQKKQIACPSAHPFYGFFWSVQPTPCSTKVAFDLKLAAFLSHRVRSSRGRTVVLCLLGTCDFSRGSSPILLHPAWARGTKYEGGFATIYCQLSLEALSRGDCFQLTRRHHVNSVFRHEIWGRRGGVLAGYNEGSFARILGSSQLPPTLQLPALRKTFWLTGHMIFFGAWMCPQKKNTGEKEKKKKTTRIREGSFEDPRYGPWAETETRAPSTIAESNGFRSTSSQQWENKKRKDVLWSTHKTSPWRQHDSRPTKQIRRPKRRGGLVNPHQTWQGNGGAPQHPKEEGVNILSSRTASAHWTKKNWPRGIAASEESEQRSEGVVAITETSREERKRNSWSKYNIPPCRKLGGGCSLFVPPTRPTHLSRLKHFCSGLVGT